MTSQRRFFCAVIMTVLAVPAIWSETVLVAVYQSGTGEMKDQSRFYLSAVEDGVMDVFFDGGHIVFNVGSFSVVGGSAVQARYDVREMAKDGGASFAVHVTMDVIETEDGMIEPVRVEYRFVNVSTDQILTQGRMELDNSGEGRRVPWEDACFSAGQDIARAALAGW